MSKKGSIGTQEMIYIALGLLVLILGAILLSKSFNSADSTNSCSSMTGGKGDCDRGDVNGCPKGNISLGKAPCKIDGKYCCVDPGRK